MKIEKKLSTPNKQYSWIGDEYVSDWAYANIFAVAVRFQIQDQFWIPHHQLLYTGHVFDLFWNISKWAHFAIFVVFEVVPMYGLKDFVLY